MSHAIKSIREMHHILDIPKELNPLLQLAEVVVMVTKKILEVSVFQLGVWKNRSARWIMWLYATATCSTKDQDGIDRSRLEKGVSLLYYYGGREFALRAEDSKKFFRCIHYTSKRFFETIDELGGEKAVVVIEGEERFVIVPKNETDSKKYKMLLEDLKTFYFPSIKIPYQGKTVDAILLPVSPKLDRPIVLPTCHSPGQGQGMSKRKTAKCLAAGYDVITWDPRGTINSDGVPSEGGLYLDADAAYQSILNAKYQGHPYRPDQIWLFGFCEGAATAADTKARHHMEGVNWIAENPFDTMENMAKNQGILGRLFAEISMPVLKSKDPEVVSRTDQNGFNIIEKFEGLPRNNSKCLILGQCDDKMIPPKAIENLTNVVKKIGPYSVFISEEGGGHLKPPTMNDDAWRHFVSFVR